MSIQAIDLTSSPFLFAFCFSFLPLLIPEVQKYPSSSQEQILQTTSYKQLEYHKQS